MNVINHIRDIRQKKGITQMKMAEDLQVTRQTINAIEKNKYNPSLELALKLIAYFDMPIDEIFILEEDNK
ncbi:MULTISPECIES: helix-turn-helix transcriptional regulator [Lactobacillales]|uniref:Putative transcriptional regulator n=1 Tax=Carnobacterium viridans TaxID=174587 RepID=A0A1H0XI70_9LACT|nr:MULTISPECIES: helix-turn-helix transcriptional regulator [Lactobacillales]KST45291.1 Cro/Cl family transcriptional regulator [Enterococcus faecium]MBK4849400.1 Cro/Cl family transcriptional regulator [Enterococcus faecium]MBK4852212.1 Cro/Cl family transcriptional regulator [Enterococcus faecium]MBK4870841.1 Cro/Cl family transcriptional regulator [Enterococcus faecium]MCM6871985.1 helix-turn-helix transcriptional regulator [Enterococcus faecium]